MKLTVHASKTYDIVLYSSFDNLDKEIEKVVRGRKIMIVCDSNTEKLYLEEVKRSLHSFEVYSITLAAGEASKNFENYYKIIETLAQNNFLRSDCVLALGGGVVGDIAGFAAATYMRGVSFVQCPTSFLAMIDSSVGGKTAIDLPEGKNLLGAFYQPDLVYIDLTVLKTLPQREVICGMGEAVKYAFLSDTVTFEMLKKGITEELIFACLAIKKDIVEGDERDKGKRALLNLGHTVGHAIENLSCFALSHGECVAKGIDQIIGMSKIYYGFSDEKELQMRALLSLSGGDTSPCFSKDEIVKQMLYDKKRELNGTYFVLLQDIGKPERVFLTSDEARKLLE